MSPSGFRPVDSAACVRIKVGRGVCGTAVARREPLAVEDVYAFPDHIFCDGDSRSELVVPLICDDTVLGVLDLDSPFLALVRRLAADGLAVVFTAHAPDHALGLAASTLVLSPQSTPLTGSTSNVLTDTILSAAYGLPVSVPSFDGHSICVAGNV